MVSSLQEAFRELNFYEYHTLFLSSDFYSLIFPFLLSFALFYAVLPKLKLFQSSKTGKPYNAVIFIISLFVSWYGVTFEISDGYSLSDLMMMLFPNISALTILILALYVVGAMFGKDFLRGLFPKKETAFVYLALGGLGLGVVLYYTGIAMGFWGFSPFDEGSKWNFILALFLFILGVTFLFVDMIPLGIIFLLVFGVYVYNSGNEAVLDLVVDPVIFIIIIIYLLMSWLLGDKDTERKKLAKILQDQEKTLANYSKKPKDYEGRIHDIVSGSYEANKKKWEKEFGGTYK